MASLNKIKKNRGSNIYQSYLSNAFLEKICEIMDKKNISNTKLASLMGVSKSEVSRLLSDNRNLTVKMLARIFYALDEKLEIMTASELSSLKSENTTHMKMPPPKYSIELLSNRYAFSNTELNLLMMSTRHLIREDRCKNYTT